MRIFWKFLSALVAFAAVTVGHASTTYQTTSSLTYTGTATNYWYFNTGGPIPANATVKLKLRLRTNYDGTSTTSGGIAHNKLNCRNSNGSFTVVTPMVGLYFFGADVWGDSNYELDVSSCFAGFDPSTNAAGGAYLCTGKSDPANVCSGWDYYSNTGTVFNSISLVVTLPTAPTATTSAASNVTATSAKLNGTVNDNGAITSVSFDYGTTNSFGTNEAATTGGTVAAGTGSTAVAKTLSGLTCNTTYYFRVFGNNSAGDTAGSEASFTTSACPTYSVTYNGNTNTGGSAPSDGSSPYTAGSVVTVLGNAGNLVKAGYSFAGWNTAANGAGSAQAAASTFAMGSAAVTLYAQWTINQYTVTFDANTGSGSMTAQSANYNVATALTSNSFTKTGYTFAGWNTVAGGGGTAYANAASYAFTASTTLYAQWTPIPIPPANPIPTVISPPPVAGVGSNLLNSLKLSSGDGPAMTICLRDQIRTVIGADAVYQGQASDGSARIGQTGLVVSFYALDATTSTSNGLGQGPGIYLRGINPLNVVTSCGTFTTVPAVYNLGEWGAFLNGMGLSATFNDQGVMTVTVDGTIYVARPDYVVTQVDPGTLTGTPRLVTGSDGRMRFTDSAGHIQILYPAFLDPEVLGNQVALAVSGYLVIQTDGTALVTLLSGEKFVLTPDLTLGTVPPEFFAVGWWQDGPNHYRYRNSSFSNTSQGFSVSPR